MPHQCGWYMAALVHDYGRQGGSGLGGPAGGRAGICIWRGPQFNVGEHCIVMFHSMNLSYFRYTTSEIFDLDIGSFLPGPQLPHESRFSCGIEIPSQPGEVFNYSIICPKKFHFRSGVHCRKFTGPECCLSAGGGHRHSHS